MLPYIRRLKGQFQKSKVRETVRRSGQGEEEEGEARGGEGAGCCTHTHFHI
jgi:hypothetical protein